MKSFLIRGVTLTILMFALLIILPNYVHAATIRVEAFIDGKSQLFIRGNMAQWYHLEWTAPGIPDNINENYPTIINSVNWTPLWTLPTSFCNCYSDPFFGVTPALPLLTQTVTLTRVQARDGVPSVTIIQQPSASNDYNLIVEFNDTTGGAAWYIIQLDFPEGDCNCYDIIETAENGDTTSDYWEVCLNNANATGLLCSESAEQCYDLYLFGGGSGWFNTNGYPGFVNGDPRWTTWILHGTTESGFLQPIGEGWLLTAEGVHDGNKYTAQGKKSPCIRRVQPPS